MFPRGYPCTAVYRSLRISEEYVEERHQRKPNDENHEGARVVKTNVRKDPML
jgi:hypothetical protein